MSTPEASGNDPETPSSSREKVMGFWEHLQELRGTIIKSVIVFAVFSGLIGYYFQEFNHVLMGPFDAVSAEVKKTNPDLVLELGTGTMMEGVSVIIQICLYGGLLLSAPFILFFIGQFVAPALTRREMRSVPPMCVSAFLLFVCGASFGFFLLLPGALHMTVKINQTLDWAFRWSVESYYSILMRLVLGVGATFQFPLIVVLLVWLGLVNTAFLRKYRRHAFVGIFVVAAVVTPSGDPFQQTALAAPLIGLYEIALLVAARIEKYRERSGAAVILGLLALLPRLRSRPKVAGLRLGEQTA